MVDYRGVSLGCLLDMASRTQCFPSRGSRVRLSSPAPIPTPHDALIVLPVDTAFTTDRPDASADADRASASQAEGREFDSRLPLQPQHLPVETIPRTSRPPLRSFFLEPLRFLRTPGGVALAVGMRTGSSEHTPIDNQVFLANWTLVEPALQDL